MDSIHRRRLHPDGVPSAGGKSPRSVEMLESEMPSPIKTPVQIRVGGLGKKTIAVDLKKLGHSIGFLPPEIERGFLGVAFAFGAPFKFRGTGNRLLCCGKIFFEQQSGRDQLGSVIIKTIHDHIRREIRGRVPGLRIQSEQIADCVGILKLIKPAQHGVVADPGKFFAGIGDSVGDQFDHRQSFLLTRLTFIFWGHVP